MLTRILATLMLAFMVLLGLELGFGIDLGLQTAVDRELAALDDAVSFVR